jgi:hypothetical protein
MEEYLVPHLCILEYFVPTNHFNIQITDLVIAQKYGTCFEAKTLVLRDFYPSIGHIKIPLIGHL